MSARVSVDVVIFGGGIAGLWTLARLRQAGYAAILLEAKALGGVQTIAAQGIIHGGTKYALTGALSAAAQAIGDMPQRWRECLAGEGELDLSRVRVLARHQHLWSTEQIASRMTGFFASKLMRSRMHLLKEGERPEPFRDAAFHGSLYRLEEPVLDLPSLMAELARQQGDVCFAVPPERVRLDPADPGCLKITTETGPLLLRARQLVLAAGAGNEALLKRLGRKTPQMQRRPLQMLMARGPLPPLYAHCLSASANPRLTVTSYPLAENETVWHLGGQIAERGAVRDAHEQIAAGKAELTALFPWIDLTEVSWAARRIDRAERATPGGKRPDHWCVDSQQGVITVWPTKLAFAPALATTVLQHLKQNGMHPGGDDSAARIDLPHPPLAQPPWDEVTLWN